MDSDFFLKTCELIRKNLVNLSMNQTFNSIGSNVFFEFGKEKEVPIKGASKKNTQKENIPPKEWTIWIGDAAWRITKNKKFLVGSGDLPEVIQPNIQKLLGKRLQSFHFLSQFLDVEFNFEGGYQITTFFNWCEENQWTVSLPDETYIRINCESPEEIKSVQNIARNTPIVQSYKTLELPKKNLHIVEITYNEYDLPTFLFEEDFVIELEICAWRLERNNEYLIGCLDCDQKEIRSKMSGLIGKKLRQIDIANSMMDARFQFEDGYVLETFTCSPYYNQWKFCCGEKVFFSAEIQID